MTLPAAAGDHRGQRRRSRSTPSSTSRSPTRSRPRYEVANPLQAIEQLTVTTLRNVIGGLTLEETLTSRDQRQHRSCASCSTRRTGKWGIRINRVELKSIDPPASIQEAMEKQMRAERDRRAAILTAEGVKQSQILDRRGREAVRGAHGRGRARGGDPARRGRGEGDRHGLPRDPRGRPRPEAAQLPVPADAAAARAGRGEQDLGHPVGVHAGAGRPDRRDGPVGESAGSGAALPPSPAGPSANDHRPSEAADADADAAAGRHAVAAAGAPPAA